MRVGDAVPLSDYNHSRVKAPRVVLYLYLFAIPSLITFGQCFIAMLGIEKGISNEALANASSIPLTPTGLRSLIGYSDYSVSPPTAVSYYFSLGINIYLYTTILYFSLRIWLRLRASVALLAADTQLREVNKQLNRVLAAQALVPLVFSIAPTMFIVMVAVCGVTSMNYSAQAATSLLWSLLPLVNGLVTILLVRPYRQTVMAKALCGRLGWLETGGCRSTCCCNSSHIRVRKRPARPYPSRILPPPALLSALAL